MCRAVISQIAPGAPLIDLTHGIARQDIRQGAVALANALPSCPPGVHLAVVDPGVGSERRAVAVAAAEGRILVGPDNGLLSRALDRLGGALDAVELSALALPPRAGLGHLPRPRPVRPGRRAPVAGRAPRRGRRVDRPGSLVELDLPTPRITDGRGRRPRDPCGRLRQRHARPRRLDARRRSAEAGDALEVRAPDGRWEAVWAQHLRRRRPGRVLLFEDSSGALALAVSGGSAAGLMDLRRDSEVTLRPLK